MSTFKYEESVDILWSASSIAESLLFILQWHKLLFENKIAFAPIDSAGQMSIAFEYNVIAPRKLWLEMLPFALLFISSISFSADTSSMGVAFNTSSWNPPIPLSDENMIGSGERLHLRTSGWEGSNSKLRWNDPQTSFSPSTLWTKLLNL